MLSIQHLLILLLIVVVVFGTKKLGNVGKDLGAAVKGFKDGMRDGNADEGKPAVKHDPTTVDVDAREREPRQ